MNPDLPTIAPDDLTEAELRYEVRRLRAVIDTAVDILAFSKTSGMNRSAAPRRASEARMKLEAVRKFA